MKEGQVLFYVQPEETTYYAEMVIPENLLGNVRQGQKVLLKFQAFPFQQFGFVVGKVDGIRNVPTKEGYSVRVILPNGLVTTTGESIEYRNEMSAEAEIVTLDIRLLERIFGNAEKL